MNSQMAARNMATRRGTGDARVGPGGAPLMHDLPWIVHDTGVSYGDTSAPGNGEFARSPLVKRDLSARDLSARDLATRDLPARDLDLSTRDPPPRDSLARTPSNGDLPKKELSARDSSKKDLSRKDFSKRDPPAKKELPRKERDPSKKELPRRDYTKRDKTKFDSTARPPGTAQEDGPLPTGSMAKGPAPRSSRPSAGSHGVDPGRPRVNPHTTAPYPLGHPFSNGDTGYDRHAGAGVSPVASPPGSRSLPGNLTGGLTADPGVSSSGMNNPGASWFSRSQGTHLQPQGIHRQHQGSHAQLQLQQSLLQNAPSLYLQAQPSLQRSRPTPEEQLSRHRQDALNPFLRQPTHAEGLYNQPGVPNQVGMPNQPGILFGPGNFPNLLPGGPQQVLPASVQDAFGSQVVRHPRQGSQPPNRGGDQHNLLAARQHPTGPPQRPHPVGFQGPPMSFQGFQGHPNGLQNGHPNGLHNGHPLGPQGYHSGNGLHTGPRTLPELIIAGRGGLVTDTPGYSSPVVDAATRGLRRDPSNTGIAAARAAQESRQRSPPYVQNGLLNGQLLNGQLSNGQPHNGPIHSGGPMHNGGQMPPNGSMPNSPMPNGPMANGPMANGPMPNGPMANGQTHNDVQRVLSGQQPTPRSSAGTSATGAGEQMNLPLVSPKSPATDISASPVYQHPRYEVKPHYEAMPHYDLVPHMPPQELAAPPGGAHLGGLQAPLQMSRISMTGGDAGRAGPGGSMVGPGGNGNGPRDSNPSMQRPPNGLQRPQQPVPPPGGFQLMQKQSGQQPAQHPTQPSVQQQQRQAPQMQQVAFQQGGVMLSHSGLGDKAVGAPARTTFHASIQRPALAAAGGAPSYSRPSSTSSLNRQLIRSTQAPSQQPPARLSWGGPGVNVPGIKATGVNGVNGPAANRPVVPSAPDMGPKVPPMQQMDSIEWYKGPMGGVMGALDDDDCLSSEHRIINQVLREQGIQVEW